MFLDANVKRVKKYNQKTHVQLNLSLQSYNTHSKQQQSVNIIQVPQKVFAVFCSSLTARTI